MNTFFSLLTQYKFDMRKVIFRSRCIAAEIAVESPHHALWHGGSRRLQSGPVCRPNSNPNYVWNSILLFFVINLFGGMNSNAQLANWSIGSNPAYGNFPTNISGQINGQCRITDFKFHPSNALKMYAVTSEGGLFMTNDAANNWTVAPGTENLTGSCASICVDYTNDQILYLGTGDPDYYSNGAGVYKSTDGGVTFTATSLTNCLVDEIMQDPLNPGTFVAETNKGMYKSTNNGLTWTATTATTIPFCDLKRNAASNSQILYACTHENNARLFRSTDFGSTWTQITSGVTTAVTTIQAGARIGVTPANPNIIYFEAVGGGGIIHKSNDGGLNFTVMKAEGAPYITFYSDDITSSSQGNYNNAIQVDVNNPAKIWLQSHNTWYSSDSGVTWTMLTHWASKVHTDMHQLEQSPYDSTKLYSSNDGGMWLSTDWGNNWVPKSNGLYAYEIGNSTGKGSRTNRDYIIIGTQDNARIYRNASGWYTINGGDDYEHKEYDYLPNGGYYYNKDHDTRSAAPGGSNVTYGLPTTGWQAIAFNRINPNIGFMGNLEIYRTSDLSSSTPTWNQISAINKTIMAIHSCIADSNRLYVITSDQKIYVSTNAMSASPTFTMYTLPAASNSLASIAAMANDANKVYIAINNKVYVSSNAGVNWTNITYNLPNVNHRRLLAEDYYGDDELVFVATNNAVYYKKATQTSWTNYSTNLPGRRAPTDFSMYDDGTSRSLIRYATFGRGVWESPFGNIRPKKAAFYASSTTPCINTGVQFFDGTIGFTPTNWSWTFAGATPSTSTLQNPIVTYSASGNYDVTLTASDGSGNTATKTITSYISANNYCTSDTVPGQAASINGTGNYAKTPVIALGTTNTVTLAAWIKIETAQPAFAGIIFSSIGGAMGLNFRNGNQIGYHYNDLSSTYNYAGGPTIPQGQWVHVALVTTASNATIYVNGVPYVNNVANAPINFNSGFNLGNDRNNTARTMIGQMDEVCFYNRALSQNEIRELMHLVKNYPAIDANLKAYYQFNEVNAAIADRSGNNAIANFVGNAARVLSTAPVGSGSSQRLNVNTTGLKSFANAGVTINFGAGTLPNGELCVTRLNIQPDSIPVGASFGDVASKYWIINNYGTNSTFTSPIGMSFTGFGNVSFADVALPSKYKLFKRSTGDYAGVVWALGDSANNVNVSSDATHNFSGAGNTSFNKQYTIVRYNVFYADADNDGYGNPLITTNVIGNTPPAGYVPNASDCNDGNPLINPIATEVYGNAIDENCDGLVQQLIVSSSGSNGSISPIGNTVLNNGQSQTYTITPNPLYIVANVVVDGISLGAITNYTFNNVTTNHTIHVTFVPACVPPVLSSAVTNITCNGGNNGVIDLTVNGGTGPFTYLWNTGATTQDINSLYAGTYTVTVTASGGCTTTTSIIVSQPAALNTIIDTVNACAFYTWSVNGNTYFNSGTYIAYIGCQPHQLNLIVTPNSYTTTTISGCSSYTWPVNGQTYFVSGTYADTSGCSIQLLHLTVQPGVYVKARAMLSGPYVAGVGLMYDSLRVNNLIPLTEPYSSSPYNKLPIGETNGETLNPMVLTTSGNDAIVDWIFIELRSANNASTVIANKRALIQRDGDVVSTDGVSPVYFSSVIAGHYFISIKHRNHLGIMTASDVSLNACTPALIDFTTIPVYTNPAILTPPRKLVGSVNAMWGGDANLNKNTKYNGASNDKDAVLQSIGLATPNNMLFPVYRAEDVNMDGRVRYNNINSDRIFILDNVGGNTPNTILFQHTPN